MARKRTVQVLLTENMENLGIVGDVVNVRPGYARNYLVPMGVATLPTPGNMKAIEERRAEAERQRAARRADQESLVQKLSGYELTLSAAANEQGQLYGSVGQQDIAEALEAEGFKVTPRNIRIGEPIKHLDRYDIPVQFASDLKTEVKLWVVSDKPQESLETEEETTETAEEAEGEV